MKIAEILSMLGYPCNLKGYQYVIDMVELMSNVNNINITDACKETAYKHNVKYPTIERNIRYGIKVSWDRADYETVESMFGYMVKYGQCPSVSLYIYSIINNMRKN